MQKAGLIDLEDDLPYQMMNDNDIYNNAQPNANASINDSDVKYGFQRDHLALSPMDAFNGGTSPIDHNTGHSGTAFDAESLQKGTYNN